MQGKKNNKEAEIRELLEGVKDPEIPVLSIVEMGMVSEINSSENNIVVKITPTFIGCPAIDIIKQDIKNHLQQNGYENAIVEVDFNTTWTSSRMTDTAREKLNNFGIAPPVKHTGELTQELLDKVKCPHCGSPDTTLNSPFGSTLCRAIRFCFSCKQGFEQFKPI